MTFGTESAEAHTPDLQERLIRVLDRQTQIDALPALVSALHSSAEAHAAVDLINTAICLDTNVLLRLRHEDIIDYLGQKHTAPLILPGQAIQEFWNNQLHAVQTMASSLQKNFDSVKKDLAKISKTLGTSVTNIDDLIHNFNEEYGYIYDASTINNIKSLMDMLIAKASVPYAPRLQLSRIAAQRKMTKTPPGFKDDGDGDFYIWADMLTGLQQAKAAGHKFEKAILISQDQKPDWSRAGVAHPILTAEVKALVDVPFEIWTIDQLSREIGKIT